MLKPLAVAQSAEQVVMLISGGVMPRASQLAIVRGFESRLPPHPLTPVAIRGYFWRRYAE